MQLKHALIGLAILATPILGYGMRHWPTRYLATDYHTYLWAKATNAGIEYCEQLDDRSGLTDDQYQFCLDYVIPLRLKRLEAQSRPDQRWPDLTMLLTDL